MTFTNTITTAVLATVTLAASSQMAYGANRLYQSSAWASAGAFSGGNGYTWDRESRDSNNWLEEHNHRAYVVDGNFYTGFQCAWSSLYSTESNVDEFPAHAVECDISLSTGVMRFVSPGETSEPVSSAGWRAELQILDETTVEVAYQTMFYKQTQSLYSSALFLMIYNIDTREYELSHATAATRNGNDVRAGVVDVDLDPGNYTVYAYLQCYSYGQVAFPTFENVQCQAEVQIREKG